MSFLRIQLICIIKLFIVYVIMCYYVLLCVCYYGLYVLLRIIKKKQIIDWRRNKVWNKCACNGLSYCLWSNCRLRDDKKHIIRCNSYIKLMWTQQLWSAFFSKLSIWKRHRCTNKSDSCTWNSKSTIRLKETQMLNLMILLNPALCSFIT